MAEMLQNSSYAGAGEHLFLSEELSNVTILVKNEDGTHWRIPAHSLVLSSQSSVFRRMLESDFAEKATGFIQIEDIRPKIVELLLGYMYRGRVHTESWRDGLELLGAAHKYQVDPLILFCARFLETILSIGNVCYVYNEACLYSLSALKKRCLRLILDAGFAVLKSKVFEILDKDSVLDIIKDPDLNIDGELTVFEALLRWAPMQCCRLGLQVTEENELQELTPFLDFVCFDDMSDTEKSALPSAVLSCMKPNNRKARVSHCVPESLLRYAHSFRFRAEHEFMECIGDSLTCVRFSIDDVQHLIGLRFMLVTAEFPSHVTMTMIKEYGGSIFNVAYVNLTSASWKEGLQLNDRKCYEAQILFRQPHRLEPKTAYKLLLADRTQSVYCPQTKLINETLLIERGHVNLSLHSEYVGGVMGLIFI